MQIVSITLSVLWNCSPNKVFTLPNQYFSPTQMIVFLGFILNSITMKEKMITVCHKLSKTDNTSYCRGSPSNWSHHFQFPRS